MMLLAAHRGASGHAPENTMAAFRAAVTARADLIECDIRFTQDRIPVVLHDRTPRRTAGGRGHVSHLAADRLTALDAGRRFHPRFTGERIPPLRTVLRELPAGMMLNCEVKTDGDSRPLALLAALLRDDLRAHGGRREVMVSSFDHRFLRVFRRVAPGVPTGVLLHPLRDLVRRPVAIARRLGAGWILCSRSRVRRSMVAAAHAHGCRVGVYTVDDPVAARRLQRFGVDMIFTNRPAEMRHALEND